MRVVGMILKIYSYLFHLVLALFLVALAIVAFTTGAHNLRLEMLPWSGLSLSYWLLGLGLAGLLTLVLALKGLFRVVFFVWTLVVLGFLIKGYFFSPYTFSGWEDFRLVLCFVLGSLLAVLGGWLQFRCASAQR